MMQLHPSRQLLLKVGKGKGQPTLLSKSINKYWGKIPQNTLNVFPPPTLSPK